MQKYLHSSFQICGSLGWTFWTKDDGLASKDSEPAKGSASSKPKRTTKATAEKRVTEKEPKKKEPKTKEPKTKESTTKKNSSTPYGDAKKQFIQKSLSISYVFYPKAMRNSYVLRADTFAHPSCAAEVQGIWSELEEPADRGIVERVLGAPADLGWHECFRNQT